MLQHKRSVLTIRTPLRKDTHLTVTRMVMVVIGITNMDMYARPRSWYQRALYLGSCKLPFFAHIFRYSIEVISIHSRHDVCSMNAWAVVDTCL